MPSPNDNRSRFASVLVLAGLAIAVIAVAASPNLRARLGLSSAGAAPANQDAARQDDSHQEIDDHAADDHSGHAHAGHAHAGGGHGAPGHGDDAHSDADAIALSEQARENIGLRVKRVSKGTFTEYIEVPGLVTDWPGRTHIIVTSPLTGVINAIHVSRGELIESNAPLFSLRLTHQDLVETQEQFLTQLGQLDVEEKEIARLSKLASSGAVAGKTLIVRQYERDKLMASVRAARQSMLLHGLTEEQIKSIEDTRMLVREITVYAPQLHEDESLHHDSLHPHPHDTRRDDPANQHRSAAATLPPFPESPGPISRLASLSQPVSDHSAHVDTELLVTVLDVSRGQSVSAGENMAQLSDYSKLLIEGHAYQQDNEVLRNAAQNQLSLQAMLNSAGGKPELIEDLKVVSIGSEIGRVSRTLPFYVEVTNQIERSESRQSHRFVSWRYKPGQRLKLRLPLKTYEDVIVVPKEAVGKEGLENYVFVDRGDHLDRVPVQLVAQGPINVAIAYDGSLKSRHKIAINSAHQLLMALRNQGGGGIDPHAGHNH